jgi:tRNA threonylcarbamoyladenosine biosynthesis protein TsaB
MAEVYWAAYAADAALGLRELCAPAVGPAAQLRLPEPPGAPALRWGGCGRGLAAYPELVVRLQLACTAADLAALPDARAIAELGLHRLRAGAGIDPADLAPLYLRDNVARTEAERGVR